MQEYVTAALALRKYPQGDLDGRYSLFTERFGRMTGKAKSSRKITSKLAPHLEPGTMLHVRFIEAHGTQIVDALKDGRIGISLIDLHFLNILLPEGQPEPEIWKMLTEGRFSWNDAFSVLGWDPEDALCTACGTRKGVHFYIPRQEFFCDICIRKLPLKTKESAVISLHVTL